MIKKIKDFLAKAQELKNLNTGISPLSNAVCHVASFTPFIVIFDPSLVDFFLFWAADLTCFMVIIAIDKRVFTRLFPETKSYFDGIIKEKLDTYSLEQKEDFLESIWKYPKRRSIYMTIASILKAPVAIGMIVFYWEHDIDPISGVLIMVGLLSLNFTYFCAVAYTECHIYLSKLVQDLHKEYDWSNVFRKVKVPELKSEFGMQIGIILTTIIIWMGLLHLIIKTGQYSTDNELILKVLLMTFLSMGYFFHIVYLNQKYLMSGLRELFAQMDNLDYDNNRKLLPLHSTELLARFEKSFNLLIDRLRASEQEIASWALNEADKSRYKTIGEISALVAHDLSAPLHVIQFCSDQIQEDPTRMQNERYTNFLANNVKKATDLVNALRARLKNTEENRTSAEITEAHGHVVMLLKTQFATENFNFKQCFKLSDNLNGLRLKISQMDLIHILDNLYRNSIQNLIESQVAEPQITIEHSDQGLLIKDNGSGLSSETFEQMTAFSFTEKREPTTKESLGLKLTRRLTELNMGQLTVLDGLAEGTTFCLDLPVLDTEAEETENSDDTPVEGSTV